MHCLTHKNNLPKDGAQGLAVEPHSLGIQIIHVFKDGKELRRDPHQRRMILSGHEARVLVTYITEDKCPLCFKDIDPGDLICNTCFRAAHQHRWITEPWDGGR